MHQNRGLRTFFRLFVNYDELICIDDKKKRETKFMKLFKVETELLTIFVVIHVSRYV